MSKRSKHKASFFTKDKQAIPEATRTMRSAEFWLPFEKYNDLPPPERKEALKQLGITTNDSDVLGILTKSHFVIPGKTRYQCQQCGECCRYARKIAQLTYDPCPFLTKENQCAKHDNRYLVCKWFPYWVYSDSRFGDLLTIKPYCSGFGKGEPIDYPSVLSRIKSLSRAETTDNDGAFVIHEVLHIPGSKDWSFPSKKNVDALMAFIARQSSRDYKERTAAEPPQERIGEVHYAHHATSGLLGAINDPLITLTENEIITDINDAFCNLAGQQRAFIIGKKLSEFFVNPERIAGVIKNCFSHGREMASPQRLWLSDKSSTPVLLNCQVFRDRSDGLIHSALICVNTVSATVFNEVSQSKNYARALLEASIDAFFAIDKDGSITDVNEATALISGRTREELLGFSFKDLFANPENAEAGVKQTFQNGKVHNYELVLIDKSQQQIAVSFNAAVYKDVDGVVQGIFAAARDIRERLKMVQALEDAKNYSRGLIECCLDLMVTINREGFITDANHAAEEISGRPLDQIIGVPFNKFFSDPQKAVAGVELTFSQGQVQNYEMDIVKADGTVVPVSFNAALYRDSTGQVQGIFAIARPT